ncbi:hypothetical protein I4U23_015311 [Adineta vaga]|nr:hypothetical protein I4U23_015311 [Adineta vaga]
MQLNTIDASCRGPTVSSHWIIPKLLLSSRYPGAEDFDEHKNITRAIYDCGIEVFVNLMTTREFARYKPYEPEIRQYALEDDRKVEFILFPIPDESVCRDDEKVLEFCLDLSKRIKKDQQKILIHCRGGRGRTGMIISILIGILFHLEVDDAINYTLQLYQQRLQTKGKSTRLHPRLFINIKLLFLETTFLLGQCEQVQKVLLMYKDQQLVNINEEI